MLSSSLGSRIQRAGCKLAPEYLRKWFLAACKSQTWCCNWACSKMSTCSINSKTWVAAICLIASCLAQTRCKWKRNAQLNRKCIKWLNYMVIQLFLTAVPPWRQSFFSHKEGSDILIPAICNQSLHAHTAHLPNTCMNTQIRSEPQHLFTLTLLITCQSNGSGRPTCEYFSLRLWSGTLLFNYSRCVQGMHPHSDPSPKPAPPLQTLSLHTSSEALS